MRHILCKTLGITYFRSPNCYNMKKLLSLLLFLPLIGFAQDGESPAISSNSGGSGEYRWEIGVNGGVNITNVSGIDSIELGPCRHGHWPWELLTPAEVAW